VDNRTLIERFINFVGDSNQEKCWHWKGSKNPLGYGMFSVNGKNRGAHRVSYEIYKGDIPPGHVIDHLCRNRDCVNPNHLEAVTHRENCLRGYSPAIQTHKTMICKRGHDMKITGTYTYMNITSCLLCMRERRKENYRVSGK
jgi:hypothetical protein